MVCSGLNINPSRNEMTTRDRIRDVQNKLTEILAHITDVDLDMIEYTDKLDEVLLSTYRSLSKIHRDLYVKFDTSSI
jgi:hypothetical protein